MSVMLSISLIFTNTVYSYTALLRVPAGQNTTLKRLKVLQNHEKTTSFDSYPIVTGLNTIVNISPDSAEIYQIDPIMAGLEETIRRHPREFLEHADAIRMILLWVNRHNFTTRDYSDYERVRIESEISGYLEDLKDIAENELYHSANAPERIIKMKPSLYDGVIRYGSAGVLIFMTTSMLLAEPAAQPQRLYAQPVPVVSLEEQEQILENFHDRQYNFVDWDDLVNDYGSEKVFYALKAAVDKKIISEDVIYYMCVDLENFRKRDNEVDSFLATLASKGCIEAYYSLYYRLQEDFIKVPNLIVTKKAVSELLEKMPGSRGPSSTILRVILSDSDNCNLIDSKTAHRFLLKMSIKSLGAKTVIKLMKGEEIDKDQREQLKEIAFLLASRSLAIVESPYRIPQILENKEFGEYDGTGHFRGWKTPTPNILEMYLYPDKNNLPKSEYRPMSITDQPPVYYSIKNWSEVTSLIDTTAWPSDFLKRLLNMKKGEILYFNGTKYYPILSLQFKTGIDLGNFLQSFGRDEKGNIYMSIYDIIDFKTDGGTFKALSLFEAQLMNQLGTSIPIYDRYYFFEEIKRELERRGEATQSHDQTIGNRLSDETRIGL